MEPEPVDVEVVPVEVLREPVDVPDLELAVERLFEPEEDELRELAVVLDAEPVEDEVKARDPSEPVEEDALDVAVRSVESVIPPIEDPTEVEVLPAEEKEELDEPYTPVEAEVDLGAPELAEATPTVTPFAEAAGAAVLEADEVELGSVEGWKHPHRQRTPAVPKNRFFIVAR